jgi:hypothetical protein
VVLKSSLSTINQVRYVISHSFVSLPSYSRIIKEKHIEDKQNKDELTWTNGKLYSFLIWKPWQGYMFAILCKSFKYLSGDRSVVLVFLKSAAFSYAWCTYSPQTRQWRPSHGGITIIYRLWWNAITKNVFLLAFGIDLLFGVLAAALPGTDGGGGGVPVIGYQIIIDPYWAGCELLVIIAFVCTPLRTVMDILFKFSDIYPAKQMLNFIQINVQSVCQNRGLRLYPHHQPLLPKIKMC